MKYFGVLLFAIGMVWSWRMVHSSPEIPLETHYAIQENLGNLLIQSLMKAKPDATEAKIEHVWSELFQREKIKVHFTYSFREPMKEGGQAESKIDGNCILQQSHDDNGQPVWVASQFTTTSDRIVFEEGLVVNAGSTPTTAPETATEPTEEH